MLRRLSDEEDPPAAPRAPTSPSETDLERALGDRLEQLIALWTGSRTPPAITVRLSSRLTRSLGRADVAKGRISLARSLAADPLLMDEALCQETVRVVTHRLVGGSAVGRSAVGAGRQIDHNVAVAQRLAQEAHGPDAEDSQ